LIEINDELAVNFYQEEKFKICKTKSYNGYFQTMMLHNFSHRLHSSGPTGADKQACSN